MSKSGLIEGFGHNIIKKPMCVCINMAKFYVPFLIMIPEEMKEDINVLGL
jgi:hypothetical protein